MFNDIKDDMSKIPMNSTIECISKANIFQETVLRVDEIEEKNEKKIKGKEMQYDHVTFQMDFIIHACKIQGGIRRK